MASPATRPEAEQPFSDQSLEEEMQSIQNEQSIKIIPDEQSQADKDDETEDFHGYTPMELETCRNKWHKRRRPLVTETDLAWEVHYDLCATVQFVISGNQDSEIPAALASGNPTTAASLSNAKPGKVRVKRASALVNEFCPKPEESGKKSEQHKKKTDEPGKKTGTSR